MKRQEIRSAACGNGIDVRLAWMVPASCLPETAFRGSEQSIWVPRPRRMPRFQECSEELLDIIRGR